MIVGGSQPTPVDDDDLPRLDVRAPQAARRYNALLGGKDNFHADRAAADDLITAFPHARLAAAENRRFLHRVVRHLAAECGIRQFLDVGVGLPASPNVHEIAQAVDPRSRVIDNDPLVAVHARALLTGPGAGTTAFVTGDLRRPRELLDHAELREIVDLGRPVVVLVLAVLHFIADADQPHRAVRQLIAALPRGSHLAVSHGTYDLIPADAVARLRTLATDPAQGTLVSRTHEQVAAFAEGLQMVEPGVVPVVDWHPEIDPNPQATATQAACYGLLARKP